MRHPFLAGLVAALSLALAAVAFAQSPGPQGAEGGALREQVWRMPAAGGSPLMAATVMRPPGEARLPLVVINHGSPADSLDRPRMARPHYNTLSSWFVSRGYVVVLPLRRGYGETGGSWAESYGPCQNPDYAGAGLQTAADIKAAIDFMRTQPFVAPDHAVVVGHSAGGWGAIAPVVVGHSAGGWGAIALSSLNPPGVSSIVNFAGGRGGHQHLPGGGTGNCATDALVQAAARYGTSARIPSLWIYAENDSFFGPRLARRMVDAYVGAGGQATYRPVGSVGHDGHSLAISDSGQSVWSPLLAAFLAAHP